MALDPKTHADWQIAQDAETRMKTIQQLGEEIGLLASELLPYGHYMGKIDYIPLLSRLADRPKGKYIDVTAITPTALGEGKSTTTIGLVQGLARRGKKASAAIRQPSGGPTMGSKGSAAGGGLSQCIPLAPFSLGLTGDINAVSNAHNLAMVALTSRMQHERNYDDETLVRLSKKPRLNIDPTNVSIGFVIDFCCQALRKVIIGLDAGHGKRDGLMMESHFDIAVSSEVMAILAIAKDLPELRQRMGKIIVARNQDGKPVTTADLGVDGAMTAWIVEAMKPNLIQTLEGQPVFVHTGPFANIAIGQNSIIADRVGLALSEYHVTESGFGADIGYEKFCNLKCHESGLTPDAVVIVATVRALKYHAGAPAPKSGTKLPEAYLTESVELVETGCQNLLHHISTVYATGVPVVVCVNGFSTDYPAEFECIRKLCQEKGVTAVYATHWEKGGEGALELADAVIEACQKPAQYKPLFDRSLSYADRIHTIATKIYGANGVDYHPKAKEKLAQLQETTDQTKMGICMVKTQFSLSDNPSRRNVPTDWTLNIRDVLTFGGAGMIVPIAGDLSLMPGTGSNPAFTGIDVDVNTGNITGIF